MPQAITASGDQIPGVLCRRMLVDVRVTLELWSPDTAFDPVKHCWSTHKPGAVVALTR